MDALRILFREDVQVRGRTALGVEQHPGIARLGQGVLLECRARLGRLLEGRHVVEGDQREPRNAGGIQDPAQFGQLLAVAARDEDGGSQLPNAFFDGGPSGSRPG